MQRMVLPTKSYRKRLLTGNFFFRSKMRESYHSVLCKKNKNKNKQTKHKSNALVKMFANIIGDPPQHS